MKLRIIYLTLALIVLLAGVAFSWMDFSEDITGNAIVYQYGSGASYYIGVANTNFRAELWILEGEEYKPVDSNAPLNFGGMVPSEYTHFKIKFINESIDNVIGDTEGSPIKVNVYLTGITTTKLNEDKTLPKLSEVLYFSVMGSEGYAEDSVNRPNSKLIKLESILEPETFDENNNPLTYRALLLENLVIPVGTEKSPDVSVLCYFLFDREATIEYENCDLNFEHILVSIAQ